MSKTLVLGANGKTGRRIAERLENRNIEVRRGSRTAAIPFDWEDQRTWHDVLQGMDHVYISFQPDLAIPTALESIRQFVAEAKSAHVQKLVLLSGRGEREAERCEQEVINSGLDYTIVRASWFMQNFSENFLSEGIEQGNLVLPDVKAREPFVDLDDLADVVVDCLLNDAHSGKIYSLTGPELLSFEEAVAIIAKATQRSIHFEAVPLSAYVQALAEAGMPADVSWLIEYLFTEVLDGRNEFVTPDLEMVLGRKLKTFQQYAAETAGAWKVSLSFA